MSVLSDKTIRNLVLKQDMISPFQDKQIRNGKISYGLSSYGYDARVGDEFKIFTNVNSETVDPKNFTPSNFVTKKIVMALTRIIHGSQKILEIGNLDAKRDWGFAGDYVEAMYLMLQQKKPDDYVIATGKTHSVRDFINKVCKSLDIKIVWKNKGIKEVGINKKNNKVIIKVNPKFYRPAEVDYLIGDYSKAKRNLSWKPKHNLDQLVQMMVDFEIENV